MLFKEEYALFNYGHLFFLFLEEREREGRGERERGGGRWEGEEGKIKRTGEERGRKKREGQL